MYADEKAADSKMETLFAIIIELARKKYRYHKEKSWQDVSQNSTASSLIFKYNDTGNHRISFVATCSV